MKRALVLPILVVSLAGLFSLASGAEPALSSIQIQRGQSANLHKPAAPSVSGFGAGVVAVPSIPSSYHTGATLICSDCHVMHASMQHNYSGGGGEEGVVASFPWSTTPTPYLLKKTSSLELCLACHDGRAGIPDVVGEDVNGGTERAAGRFGQPEVTSHSGHNLGADPGDLCLRCHFGGDPPEARVTCTDCHNPHGNPSYRNLWWASAPGSEPPIIAFTNSDSSGMAKYQRANVTYGAPAAGDDTWREIINMCIDCHHAFMDGEPPNYTNPDGGHWNRHPGTNTEWGARRPINRSGANTDPANWEGGSGPEFDIGRLPFVVSGATDFASAGVVAQDNEVFCLSCHKAHGNTNSFGLLWNPGEPSTPLEATAGCHQCHGP
jgi:hypothetical protein